MEPVKSPFLSKTLWVNAIIAIGAFFPGVQAFIQSSPEIFTWGFVVINMILRLITKKEISIS